MLYKEIKEKSTFEILKNLCGQALGEKSDLGMTEEEASGLLENLVKKDELIEKIKRVEINRKPFRIKHCSTFKRYFETMGHNGIIERICFDNSCKYAFSGGSDGIIKCWSITDGMLIQSLYGHSNMISDLCINNEGNLLVSVDYSGLINIWDLNEFKLLYSVNLSSEAIFCEFINTSIEDSITVNKANMNNITKVFKIFIVLSDGSVKSILFNLCGIIEEKKNVFIEGESIKSICITDGGRLVICGGWWPFVLVYDTQNLGSIIVLEEFRIQTLCAARNALKFAASNENQIFSYTFFCEGMSNEGNFIKKRVGNENGYWKKYVNVIDGEYFVEWLSFLPSFLLVASCSDNIIRVYEDDRLILSFEGEVGTIYSHPTEDVFVVVGTRLSIYQICKACEFPDVSEDMNFYVNSNKPKYIVGNEAIEGINEAVEGIKASLIYSEEIYISLNDCQFSDDGRYFITCDDQGIIRAYSTEEPIEIPEQQFFMSDFAINGVNSNINGINGNGNINGVNSNINGIDDNINGINNTDNNSINNKTVNIYKQPNTNWFKVPYIPSSFITKNKCIQIEDMAISSLEKLRYQENKFKAKFLSKLYAPEISVHEEQQSSNSSAESNDETYIMSESAEDSTELDISDTLLIASEETSSTEQNIAKADRSNSRSSSSASTIKRRRTKKLRGYRKTESNMPVHRNRRFIIEESEESYKEQPVEPIINTRQLRRSLESNNNARQLRRDIGSIESNNNTRLLRRSIEPISNTRQLRRSIESENTTRLLRRSIEQIENISTDQDNYTSEGIDPEFEITLSNFSHDWIAFCSIYIKSKIYFNAQAYLEFMELEPRISYSKSFPKKSGFYSVTSQQYKFIGKIPFLIIGLDSKYLIKIYEYPHSMGIICTEDQYNIKEGDDILYYKDSTLNSATVVACTGLSVNIGAFDILKSTIAIQYPPLNIQPVPYSVPLKALFGLSRTQKFIQRPVLNYSLINFKLSKNLYKNVSEFVNDLKCVSDFASKLEEPLKGQSYSIYKQYFDKLL